MKQQNRKSEIGKLGENLASQYLKRKGYKIVSRNYWKPWGEIDIIARAKDKTLAFVEVKTMRSAYQREVRESHKQVSELKPEDQITQSKVVKLKKSAEAFSNAHPEIISEKGWRIDLIAIILPGGDNPEIIHYQNIV